MDVVAGRVAGLLDRAQDEIQRLAGGAQIGREAALVAQAGGHAGARDFLLERVEHLGPHAHGVAHRLGRHGHDHEFLDVDRVVGVLAAVDDVHHRHRQDARRGAADIAVERQGRGLGRRLGHRQADAEDRVGAQPALVVGAVEFDHRQVDADLFRRVEAQKRLGDLAVDARHGFQHALALVARVVAVTPFDRLVGAGGGARGHRGAAQRAVLQRDVDLDRGVAAAVEDLAGVNVDDGAHGASSLRLGKCPCRCGL